MKRCETLGLGLDGPALDSRRHARGKEGLSQIERYTNNSLLFAWPSKLTVREIKQFSAQQTKAA